MAERLVLEKGENMCLENRLSGKTKEKAIAAMPETFRVWKYCPRMSGGPEYQNTKAAKKEYAIKGPIEPGLKVKKWYKAGHFPGQRSKLEYIAGFHAFLDKAEVDCYYEGETQYILEFEARRSDIKEIGTFDRQYGNLKGVVLSHIKPVGEKDLRALA